MKVLVDFPPELHELFKIQAAKEHKTMKALLGEIVREYLSKKGEGWQPKLPVADSKKGRGTK